MRIVGFKEAPPLIRLLRRLQEGQRGGGLSTLVEQRTVPREMMVTAIPRLQASLGRDLRHLLVLRAEGDRDDARTAHGQSLRLSYRGGRRDCRG